MGRYFGREPRYSREEAEAQAKAAIDAAMQKGRPPEEEWKGLASRMGDINRELATRPPVDIPPPPPRRRAEPSGPRVVSQILRPQPAPEPEPEPAAPPRPTRPSTAQPAATRATGQAPAPVKRGSPGTNAGPAPAKRANPKSAKTAAPVKRSARATNPPAPAPAKRPATKKRQG